ncbi:NAD(P)H-dependent flavin oxidoreductase [Oryzicola mucosus]|uniref:Nitronate monooxygenase n=1 Tax=Oryzicola mucosus TaxID=2767425 RepID=A0A8J6PW59_9HYPH|nr:nitronate monooxygenase [Oryzicola mucosus]MBD0417329.1 nitronate monooxygenase [Oryzicola mucosus]
MAVPPRALPSWNESLVLGAHRVRETIYRQVQWTELRVLPFLEAKSMQQAPAKTIRTDFTDLMGIRFPIINAGMGWVSLPKMVAAVSNAGGLGILGAGVQPPSVVADQIREIRELTEKPFGINCPLAMPNAVDNAKLALKEQVPVINYSMGRGDWIAEGATRYGGKTIASVNSVKLARSAQERGADAIIATGYEAAGHAGEIGTFVLVPRLAELLDIPVIAAGGVTSGAGLLGALALGASGVSLGTRFATATESTWHENFKKAAIERDVHDTLISEKFGGSPNRLMRTEQAEKILRSQVNPFHALLYSFQIAREMDIPLTRVALDAVRQGPKRVFEMISMASMQRYNKLSFEGDVGQGTVHAGQSIGLIHDTLEVAEIIRRIITEAEDALARLNGIFPERSGE